MQAQSPPNLLSAYGRSVPRECPSCRCELVRERRRIVDRLVSLVQPIRRYRCQNFACQWVGNFVVSKTMHDLDPPPHRVPVAFVVHMALVAAGIVAVVVVSNMEPTSWTNGGELQLGSSNDYEKPAERAVTQTEPR